MAVLDGARRGYLGFPLSKKRLERGKQTFYLKGHAMKRSSFECVFQTLFKTAKVALTSMEQHYFITKFLFFTYISSHRFHYQRVRQQWGSIQRPAIGTRKTQTGGPIQVRFHLHPKKKVRMCLYDLSYFYITER